MICKLLFPLLAIAITLGQPLAETLDDVPAHERPLVEEAALDVALDEPLSVSPNDTLVGRANLNAKKLGAYIERVTLSKCPKYSSYLPYFYGGFVVNSRAWQTKGNERFTSIATLQTDGTIISSSAGAHPSKKQYIFHTWEMIYFTKSFQDIRTAAPSKLIVQSWNAMQQLYIPLYMSSRDTGNAYMLHIYPEPSFLAYPNDYSYDNGLLWAKGDINKLYRFEIDIEGMIRDLDNFSSPNYKRFITAHGVVETNGSSSQNAVTYPDKNQVTLKGTTLGTATEYVCTDSKNQMDLTWDQMRSILQREMTWL